MHPATGGLLTYLELLTLTEKLQLPDAVAADPVVARLTRMANNVDCWINDLISLGKELRQGDVHNLVLILRRHYQVNIQEAICRAAALYDAEIRAFLDTELLLPDFGPDANAEVERYLTCLKAWMRGSLDWSYTSGRYLLMAVSIT